MSLPSLRIAPFARYRPVSAAWALSSLLVLSACGGGGGDGSGAGGGGITPPPPVNAAELSVLVTPVGNPVASSSASQKLATVKLSNVGKGVAVTTDLNITADAALQDIKVLNCKSDNAASACPASGSRMTVSQLQPGASLSFDVAGLVQLGTSQVIQLGASASTSNGGHQSSSAQSVGLKAYSVDVAVQASGPSTPVPPGGSFDFVLTVSNKGPDAAQDALLRSDLLSSPVANAPSLGPIRCSASGGAVCPSTLTVGDLKLPSLPKEGALVLTFPYQFAPGVTQRSLFNASVQASADVDPRNNTALVATP